MNPAVQEQNATTYAIDASHSSAEFVVRHLMISKVRGRFSGLKGTVEVPAGSDLPSKIDVEIDAASVDTREAQRDAHLKSPDFFDVEQYPALRFVASTISGSPESFQIAGDLTIHGVTRQITLDASFEGRTPDPWGGSRIGYSARTAINRKDFGLTWNAALETGGVVVGDDVKVELEVEAIAQQ